VRILDARHNVASRCRGAARSAARLFLHGLPTDPDAYRRQRIQRLGQIAADHGRPVIVVAPQGTRKGDRDPEWHDWRPGRDWETAVARDVVNDVDDRYRTIADRRARAIIGISGGGYGAMLIGLHHPETFTAIESWSGYFHPTNPKGDKPLDVGDAHEDAKADAHRFVACLGRLAATDRPSLLGFFIGDRDPLFLSENVQLNRELDAAHVPHVFRIYHGAHKEPLWRSHEREWLVKALRVMPTAPPPPERDPAGRRLAAQRAGCPID
jgi:enterochelin esterase-like enzyme